MASRWLIFVQHLFFCACFFSLPAEAATATAAETRIPSAHDSATSTDMTELLSLELVVLVAVVLLALVVIARSGKAP